MAYQGFVDPIQNDKLIGWVWDDARPAVHVSIQVILDGRPWEKRAAFRYRPDLQRAGVGQGDHAFGIDLPQEVFDGNPHSIAVKIDGSEWHLIGSPFTFQSRYEGRVAGADAKRIWGFASDAARPSQPIAVTVRLDGRYLVEAVTVDGKFEVKIPPYVEPHERIRIELLKVGGPLLEQSLERVHVLDLLRSLRRLGTASLELGGQLSQREDMLLVEKMLEASMGMEPYRLVPLRPTVSPCTDASGHRYGRRYEKSVLADSAWWLEQRGNQGAASPLSSSIHKLVDVIMPVYEGESQTVRAIESVLESSNECPFHFVVFYDNPANQELLARIRDLQRRATAFELIENAGNLGFTATANRGLALHPDRDVVLLNSDTAVHGNWLDRLKRAAYANLANGSATPFSNNATICSYPRFPSASPVPRDPPLARLDEIFSAANAGQTLEIPTGVGFCMYVRRECLNETGGFDAVMFGAGYGEENDFCQRSAMLGWRHVLAADVYVEHEGGVSFGASASEKSAANYQKLIARWPLYDSEVRRFIATDPVLPFRRKVDLERAAASAQPSVALASNLLGGGTERHVQETAAALIARGESVMYLRFEDSRRVQINLPSNPDLLNLVFHLPEDRDELATALQQLKVSKIHFHQVIGAPRELFDLAARHGIAYDCTLHDYSWVCPQVNLIDASRVYCGEPDVDECERCLRTLGNHKDWQTFPKFAASVRELREFSSEALRRAGTVYTPSTDTAKRFYRYFPAAHIVAAPHDRIAPAKRMARRSGDELARVVLIGSIGLTKGYDVLYACARHARQHRLPIRFLVVGATLKDRELEALGNVEITGDYAESIVQELVARQRGHVSLFPNVWPETFSYTLTIAFQAGLWPVAFDLGAIGDRIRQAKFGKLMDLDTNPESINRILLDCAGA